MQLNETKQRIKNWLLGHSSWIRKKYPVWAAKYNVRKAELEKRWRALKETERLYVTLLLFMAGFIIFQFFWIIALQVQVSMLASQTDLQETRLTQVEQSNKKQNNILYSTYTTVKDIENNWSDLNFRVLQNTWKLDQ